MTTKYIHKVIKFGVFRLSWYAINFKKFTLRFEISYGWDK